jgi:lysozyme
MKTSPIGIDRIVHREGVFLHAYRDSVGVWTIGTGHTSAAGPPHVYPGMAITEQDNDKILAADLAPIEKQVNNTVKVPLLQNEFDALVSVIFNVGPKFLHSTAMRRLNAGDKKGAAAAFMMWNIPHEIIGRRNTERMQFLTPYRAGRMRK